MRPVSHPSGQTSEAFVSRVGLGIFVYKPEVEEQPVHYDLAVPVGCRFYHQQSLAYGSPLFYARLDACDVLHRIAFCEVTVPTSLKADIFAFYLDPCLLSGSILGPEDRGSCLGQCV